MHLDGIPLRRCGGRFAVLLLLCALGAAEGSAQDAVKPEEAKKIASACHAPSAFGTVPGFLLTCGKRIPIGVFLGAFSSSANLSYCPLLCAAHANCAAFSLDTTPGDGSNVCRLFASIDGYADDKDSVVGIRIKQDSAIAGSMGSAVSDMLGTKKIAMGGPGRDSGGLIWDDASLTQGTGKTYSTIFNSKTFSDVFANKGAERVSETGNWSDLFGLPWPHSSKAADPLPPGVKWLQPVYFATDRVVASGPLVEASFTDEPDMNMKFGYAVVSLPKSHLIGNVERPRWKWYKLGTEKEDAASHFRIKELVPLAQDAFIAQLKAEADSLLLYIHGYNQSFSDAVFKAAQIAYDANFGGAVMTFSWPSAGNLFKYDKDRNSAEFAEPHLAQVLQLLTDQVGKKSVYVVAHSMGNQLLVNALQQAALSKTKLNLTELVMAAPDVDTNVFKSKVDKIRAVAGNITMYASSADKALLASGVKSFGTRLGYVGPDGPNIFTGIETIDVTAVGDDMFGLDHDTFSSSRAVLNDLGHLIRSLTHLKPDMRTPTLKFVPDRANVRYWLYPR